MKSGLIITWISALILLQNFSCKKGFEGNVRNQALPETYVICDSVRLSSDDRLTTRVQAHWYGSSAGGYIVGYEVSTDSMQHWGFTTRQDSLFLLNIPPGKDSADIVIYFRAVDNIGQKDPTPASTLYPIKNTPPQIHFIYQESIAGSATQNPSISFPVVSYSFAPSDADGINDIQEIELYLNDTTQAPFIISGKVNYIMLEALHYDSLTQVSDCKVYTGNSSTPLSTRISGMKLNATNILYLRVTDKALMHSSFVASTPIWIRRPVSDVLLVNAYNSAATFARNFYAINLSSIGIKQFDTLFMTEQVNSNYTQLSADLPTQNKVFALFKKIVWFGDDASFSLGIGQRSTSAFFANNGKLFMALEITSGFDPLSTFLDFTPVQSLVALPGGQFRMGNGYTANPILSGWPQLKTSKTIDKARPFYIPQSSSSYTFDSVYRANMFVDFPANAWGGSSSVISIKRKADTQKATFIFSSLPLQSLNGNNNMDSLFRKIFIDELEFEK